MYLNPSRHVSTRIHSSYVCWVVVHGAEKSTLIVVSWKIWILKVCWLIKTFEGWSQRRIGHNLWSNHKLWFLFLPRGSCYGPIRKKLTISIQVRRNLQIFRMGIGVIKMITCSESRRPRNLTVIIGLCFIFLAVSWSKYRLLILKKVSIHRRLIHGFEFIHLLTIVFYWQQKSLYLGIRSRLLVLLFRVVKQLNGLHERRLRLYSKSWPRQIWKVLWLHQLVLTELVTGDVWSNDQDINVVARNFFSLKLFALVAKAQFLGIMMW